MQFKQTAKRLLDAATTASHIPSWSDSEEDNSDDGDIIESEEFEDSGDDLDHPLPGEGDGGTHGSANDPSDGTSQSVLVSEEIEISDSSMDESDNDDSTGSGPSGAVAQSSYKARNGRIWVTTCPQSSRTRACNLRHTAKGPVSSAKNIQNEEEAFACFIDEDMLQQIVKHTNNRARRDLRAKNRSPDEWVPVDLCEKKGVDGLLYLIGVYRSQRESLRSLWSSGRSGRPIFSASFGRGWFEQIIANLRFDSREDRSTEDKFAAFR